MIVFPSFLNTMVKKMLFIIPCIFLLGCKNEYRELIKSELAKNERQDTLFLGIRFGMTSRDFFNYCWELNKEGIVNEGHSNRTVLYKLARFDKRYDVNLYPVFVANKIVSLPVYYSYDLYAPWNPVYSLDTLFKEVIKMQKELYGNDFLTYSNSDDDEALVRVDRNRRISIFKNPNTNTVSVLYKDLSVKAEVKEQ